MTKTRHKLLGYLIILIPFALLVFSPFSESIRRALFRRYQVRWHLDSNHVNRAQTITVRNNGDESVPHVNIKLNVQSKAAPIADFAFAGYTGYHQSFLDSVTAGDQQTFWEPPNQANDGARGSAPGRRGGIRAVTDEHAPSRTLYTLDYTLDDLLKAKLRADFPGMKIVDELENSANSCDAWHQLWIQQCKRNQHPPNVCQQVGDTIGSWEDYKRGLLEQARDKWSKMTGANVAYNRPGSISPTGDINFTFGLEGNETRALRLDYNMTPSVSSTAGARVVSGPIGSVERVRELSDLELPLPWYMLKYHLWLVVITLLVGLGLLRFFWPHIRPKNLLPVHKVFNTALTTEDHEYWDHAYQRYRFYILQKFRELRHTYQKEDLSPDTEEILDYVRKGMISRYQADPRKLFKSERALNRFIHLRLQFLVIFAS